MSTQEYDLVVLGGGPGGYAAAVRAAQLGKKVAIVEKEKIGGTCLHRGCIPSKTLLRSAEVYATVQEAGEYGIHTDGFALDFTQVTKRKDEVVQKLYDQLRQLMKQHHIEVVQGYGRVIGPSIFSPKSGSIAIDSEDEEGGITLVSRNLIIATGSKPKWLPGWDVDGKTVLTSDDALRMEQLPDSILIVGGGVIGIEWASMLNDFGVAVTLVESCDRILPNEDEFISKQMTAILQRRGVRIHCGVKITPATIEADKLSVQIEKDGKSEQVQVEKVLLSVGRSPNIERIGIENTGIQTNEQGIVVNKYFQTAESHIYAIGDCIGGQLAHVATRQGILAVEHMAGMNVEPFSWEQVPRCIYSRPEVAAIGLSEQQAREQGYRVRVANIPFSAVPKAVVLGSTEGVAKVITDETTEDILGVHLIGPQVTELISEASLAQLVNASAWEVAQTIHPHPSLSEALFEAMAVLGKK